MRTYMLVIFLLAFATVFAQDGSPDMSFGDNGIVLRNFGESSLDIYSVSQNADGRIAVIRYRIPYSH